MKSHKIKTSKEALKFMFSGKSIFTFVNSKTGNRFTFKIKQAKDSNMFFISVLTNPEQYSYIGTCIEGKYKHGKKSFISENAQSVKVFKYMLKNLINDTVEDFLEVWHEGFCGKCGKRLTVPSSIETGIGPDCMKKLSKQEKRDKFLELILS
jgi:hypothetical protein